MADKGLEDIEQSQIESNYDETVDSFDEMALKAELLRGKMIDTYILGIPVDPTTATATPLTVCAR